jgi:hypothetical protein
MPQSCVATPGNRPFGPAGHIEKLQVLATLLSLAPICTRKIWPFGRIVGAAGFERRDDLLVGIRNHPVGAVVCRSLAKNSAAPIAPGASSTGVRSSGGSRKTLPRSRVPADRSDAGRFGNRGDCAAQCDPVRPPRRARHGSPSAIPAPKLRARAAPHFEPAMAGAGLLVRRRWRRPDAVSEHIHDAPAAGAAAGLPRMNNPHSNYS